MDAKITNSNENKANPVNYSTQGFTGDPKIDDEIRIVENRGGKIITLVYPKYQLVGMHTARRSFATNMYKRRFPTISIMKLTGHTTESNFLKYIKVTPEENAVMMAEEFLRCKNPF